LNGRTSGNGPLIGSFSTPFARVVQAALAARKKGNSFAPADVTPDLTAPELHVIALAQTAATDDGMVATVLSVMLARRGSKDPADVIQPLKTNELTAQYQSLAGTAFKTNVSWPARSWRARSGAPTRRSATTTARPQQLLRAPRRLRGHILRAERTRFQGAAALRRQSWMAPRPIARVTAC